MNDETGKIGHDSQDVYQYFETDADVPFA